MKFHELRFHRRALAFAVGTILGVSSVGVSANEGFGRSSIEDSQEQVEVFIRLSTPSVAELNAVTYEQNGQYASRSAQQAQARRVDAEQAAFRANLAAFGARELSAQRVGANGLRVLVPAGQIDALKSLPGVRSVGRVERHEPMNITSVPWTGATALNALGLTGKGVSIGIIDTGVDYLHANLGGSGNPADYAANNKNIIEPGTFPNAKVVGGWDFAGPTYNANVAGSVPAPDPDPLDGNGHGSHVAGSAAGLGVPGIIGPGAAPDAKIYALKVFGDGGGSTNLTSLAIEWAMDPNGDGDMSDRLDVINMSLGSSFGEPNDPSAITAENAARVGIIVVASAGNSGDMPYVTGAPGVAHSAISVAANVPGGRDFATLTIDSPASIAGAYFNEEGTSPTRVSDVAPLSGTVVEAQPLDGCTPLANAAAVNGNIVLMIRGGVADGTPAGCAFAIKAQEALNAGATAMIMVNNVAGDPIVMGAITAAMPSVMISLPDGQAIMAQATTDASSPVTATFGFGPDPTKGDRIAVFSSSGPGSGGTTFKPDLAAPGVGIISTGRGTGTGPAPNQGTSMAAPHVAGAAALLRQKFPKENQAVIKALLMNSTVDANPSAGADTSLSRNGVGAMRVDRAAALSSYVTPAGVSFGRINPTTTTTISETVYLNNMKTNSRNFTVTHVPQQTYPGVTVTCPSSASVGKWGTKALTIKLRFDPKAAPAAGIFDNASASQREVDGWCVFSDGTDELRVGYMAAVDSASNMTASPGWGSYGLDIKNSGPAIGFAEGFTLAGTGSTGAKGTYSAIEAFGYRTNTFGTEQVVEFGIAFHDSWDHVSNLDVDIFLDVNKDGVEDVRLAARDWTVFQASPPAVIGTYVTAQFPVAGGSTPFGAFLDWIAGGWDFSDRVVVLPWTRTASGGQVPDSFNYRVVAVDRQGNVSTQTGTIDLANEIVPDLNSFGLLKGDTVHVNVNRKGKTLWLFPNNEKWYQTGTVYADPPKGSK